METTTSRSRERGFAMPGGYPAYPETYPEQQTQIRSLSRPASSRDSEQTDVSSVRTTSQSSPPRGILKTSTTRRPEDPLAARFYRVSRPEQIHQVSAPLPAPLSAPQSPTYHSDTSFCNFDTETESQSTSSELSVNTQATSVDSDITISKPAKPTKPSTQVKHVRHVPPPTVSRVKARPRGRSLSQVTKAPSQVTKAPSQVTKAPSQVNKAPSQVTKTASQASKPAQNGKRTVHIQFLPPAGNNPTTNNASQDMQVARRSDQALLYKIERLEDETESLRKTQSQLTRNLDDASGQLSARGRDYQAIVRTLNFERNSKELILRDLEEQRLIFDEYRNNYELQQSMLLEVERERDSFRQARDKFEKQLVKLEKEMTRREAVRKEEEESLKLHLTTLEKATTTLEKRISSRDREVERLASERRTLRETSEKQLAELKILKEEHEPSKEERNELKKEQQKLRSQLKEAEDRETTLQDRINGFEAEIRAFRSQVAALETDKQALEKSLESEKGIKAELESRLQAKESEIKELQDQVEASKTIKQDFEKQLGIIKGDLEKQVVEAKQELERQVETFKVEMDEKQSTVDRLIIEIAGSKDANISLASQKLEAETQLANVRANLSSVQTELGELHERYRTLEDNKDLLALHNVDLLKKSDELDRLREEHTDLDNKAKSLQADINKNSDTIKALREAKDKIEAHAKDLESGSAFGKLRGEKIVLEARLTTLQAEADKIPILAQEKAELADQIKILTQEKTTLETRLQSLQAEADKAPALAQQIQILVTQLSTVNQQLTLAHAAQTASTTQLHDLQATLNRVQNRSPTRSNGRSTSRAPPKRHARSPSSSFVFVRNPSEKGGNVFITTRDSLKDSSKEAVKDTGP